jgi:hypothetical protein
MEFSEGSEENHERPEDHQPPHRELKFLLNTTQGTVTRCMFTQRFKSKISTLLFQYVEHHFSNKKNYEIVIFYRFLFLYGSELVKSC